MRSHKKILMPGMLGTYVHLGALAISVVLCLIVVLVLLFFVAPQ